MPRPKKTVAERSPKTKAQLEIEAIRAVGKDERTEQMQAHLVALLADERRDRFARIMPGRIQKFKRAAAAVERLGAPAAYQYEEAEANGIVGLSKAIHDSIVAAFRGAPKERGLFDF